ncbi:cytochrome c oxidase subunit 3 family protein [Magnetovirga frankeli]|nr:cytochrome c oxidase subunit 3 family protein [gamma proteobacterium SS-5]
MTASEVRAVPGNTGIWVGIFCVLVEYLLLLAVYFIAKAHNPEAFELGPDKLADSAGLAITLLLLSSGYAMLKAVQAIRRDAVRAALRWVVTAFVLGLGYPLIKLIEFRWNLAQGVNVEGGVFYTVYYYLTLNHLVHVFWGLLGLIWVALRLLGGAYSAADHRGLEAAALYWHTTDLIWLALFSLFYVLR